MRVLSIDYIDTGRWICEVSIMFHIKFHPQLEGGGGGLHDFPSQRMHKLASLMETVQCYQGPKAQKAEMDTCLA